MHIYDYIIIGSGLTGLTIAKKISQETDNILILEAQDFPGGSSRPATLKSQTISNGLRFTPASEPMKKSLSFLQSLLSQRLQVTIEDHNIETYEASGFKKFVGFGEKSPEFYEQLSYFLGPQRARLNSQPYEWVSELTESLQNKIQCRSFVTRFGFENLSSDNPQLTHVLVNGTKAVYARQFIFAGQARDLHLLLPDEILNVRAKAKLKKSKSWQAVCVDLLHAPATEGQQLYLLNGTTDDDIGPCIGCFLTPQPAPSNEKSSQDLQQVSQWLSFVDAESAEDTENIGLVLKKIKRQIKRAFPQVSDTVLKERIFVTPSLSGADMKVNANGTLPKVENLWLASAQFSPYQNLLGSLMQAQFILSSLGFSVADMSPDFGTSHVEARSSVNSTAELGV